MGYGWCEFGRVFFLDMHHTLGHSSAISLLVEVSNYFSNLKKLQPFHDRDKQCSKSHYNFTHDVSHRFNLIDLILVEICEAILSENIFL